MLKFTAQVHLHLCLQWTKIFSFLRVHYEAHNHSLQVEKRAGLSPSFGKRKSKRKDFHEYLCKIFLCFLFSTCLIFREVKLSRGTTELPKILHYVDIEEIKTEKLTPIDIGSEFRHNASNCA